MGDADAGKQQETASSTPASAIASAKSTNKRGEIYSGATSTPFTSGDGQEGSSDDGSFAGCKDETKKIGPAKDKDSRTSGVLAMDIARFFQKPATALTYEKENSAKDTNTNNADPNRKSMRDKEEARRGEKVAPAVSTAASISHDKSAGEDWYDNLPAEHKHIVDQGIKSMFYKGCLMAIRRSFNTVVNQTKQDKKDAAAAKKKKSKREREREQPHREKEQPQRRRDQLFTRREQSVSGMPPHPHVGPNRASGSLGSSHSHPPLPFGLTDYNDGGGSRENNGSRPGFHPHNHGRPPPYGYGYVRAQVHSLHPLHKYGPGSGPKQLPHGIFEDHYYGRSGRYDNTSNRNTSNSVSRGCRVREGDNNNFNSSNSNHGPSLAQNCASASAEMPYYDNPSNIGASAPYGVPYSNQDFRDWEGRRRSRSSGGDGVRTRRRRSSRSCSVEDRPSRRLEGSGRSSTPKRGREHHKEICDSYYADEDGSVGKSSARFGHYCSRSRSPSERKAVDGATSLFNNIKNGQEHGINQNERMIANRNMAQGGTVVDELPSRSSPRHSKKSKRHDCYNPENRSSRRGNESISHRRRRRRSRSSSMTSYHEHKQISRKRWSNKRQRKLDDSLENDSFCNTRDRDERHRTKNHRSRSQSPAAHSDDSRDNRREGRSSRKSSRRRKKRHRRHRSSSSTSRSQPERKASMKKHKRDQSRKDRG